MDTRGSEDFLENTLMQLQERHPNGIEPWGNYFQKQGIDMRSSSLGIFSIFDDQTLLEVVLPRFEAAELLLLSSTSKAMYIFCSYEELWKALTLRNYPQTWTYRINWKMTYLSSQKSDCDLQVPEMRKNSKISTVFVNSLYSDYIYQAWQCANTPLDQLAFASPENVPRCSNLSPEQFWRTYEIPNKPVIITNVVCRWNSWTTWTVEELMRRFSSPHQQFQVGDVQMDLKRFFTYCHCVSNEEQPLYMFDNKFGEKYPDLLADYSVPEYFEQDYFSILDQETRPSYRWIFVGPPRSGSTFHKDPNSTSAWNGLIRGKKLWIFYPPNATPPSVFPSKNGFHVTTPVSVMEWILRNFHETLKFNSQALVCIQNPGDLIFVPNQWWHLVLNLELSIGVTQNYVGDCNLKNVCLFLQKKNNQTLWNSFRQLMTLKHPEKKLTILKPKISWQSNEFRFSSS